MNWIFFALISITSMSVGNIILKIVMRDKESDPITSALIFQLICILLTFLFALMNGFVIPPIGIFFPYLMLSGVLYALGTALFFKAVKEIEISYMTIISGFGAVATIISAYFFLGERLGLPQIFGVILVMLSIAVVSYEGKKFSLNKGFVYSLAATTLFGLAITSDTYILSKYDAVSYTPVGFFAATVFLVLMYPKKTLELHKVAKIYIRPNILIFGFLYSVQAIAYYLAIQNGAMASQMNSIFKAEVILTIILATIFLKEKNNLYKKIIAAILTMFGVILIA